VSQAGYGPGLTRKCWTLCNACFRHWFDSLFLQSSDFIVFSLILSSQLFQLHLKIGDLIPELGNLGFQLAPDLLQLLALLLRFLQALLQVRNNGLVLKN